MKSSTPALIVSLAARTAQAANFTTVDLTPPLNWVVGTYLFPAEIIAGYNAAVDSTDWTEETWDAHILAACESYTACTSSITWQGTYSSLVRWQQADARWAHILSIGINSGSTGGT